MASPWPPMTNAEREFSVRTSASSRQNDCCESRPSLRCSSVHLGVSGDTSCADHMIGWRVRNILNLDYLAGIGGVSGDAARPDNIVYDITPNPAGGTGVSAGGFGHPTCIRTGDQTALPAVR